MFGNAIAVWLLISNKLPFFFCCLVGVCVCVFREILLRLLHHSNVYGRANRIFADK